MSLHSASPVQVIDLFCGAGGLSYGLKQAGLEVKAGLDLDPACEYPFQENVGGVFLKQDLATTAPEDLQKFYDEGAITLLAGCAPCQPFSTLSNGRDRKSNAKWPLLNEFARMAEALKPDFVTMENVPALRGQSIFGDFVSLLKRLRYHVAYNLVDAAAYGVPQRRKRLILLASRLGPIRLVTPDELGLTPKTVRQAISHLSPLKAGEADADDPLHRVRNMTDINLRRLQASKPGGTWEDWPEELRLECHKKASGSTFKAVYGRMEWDKPSGTMTTQSYNIGTGRFAHPVQDRSVSLREMAILQSFPDDYKFVPPGRTPEFAPLGRLIGNAVPVGLGYAIGRSIEMVIKSSER